MQIKHTQHTHTHTHAHTHTHCPLPVSWVANLTPVVQATASARVMVAIEVVAAEVVAAVVADMTADGALLGEKNPPLYAHATLYTYEANKK